MATGSMSGYRQTKGISVNVMGYKSCHSMVRRDKRVQCCPPGGIIKPHLVAGFELRTKCYFRVNKPKQVIPGLTK